MVNLSKMGCIFYGAAIAGIGLQAMYCHQLPYILQLPQHTGPTSQAVLAVIFGAVFTLAGAAIISAKNARQTSLLFAGLLLLLFCFYYIPYQFLSGTGYTQVGEWENAAKELTLAGGAFVIAGCFTAKNEDKLTRFLSKLVRFGAILFAITMMYYGILHFLFAKEAATMIPVWIPGHMFWMYFCGIALFGSGVAIILNISTRVIAALLGTMIFIWFIALHIPRVVAAATADLPGEITSAFFAFAYSGIAFVVSGSAGRK